MRTEIQAAHTVDSIQVFDVLVLGIGAKTGK